MIKQIRWRKYDDACKIEEKYMEYRIADALQKPGINRVHT